MITLAVCKPTYAHSPSLNLFLTKSLSLGHITPLAAYHPTERMVLILETNQKRASHHWINVDALTLLMTCVDRSSKKPRGYLLVSLESKAPPSLTPAISV